MTCDRPDVQEGRPDVGNIRLEDCQIMVVESEKIEIFKNSKIFIEIFTCGILGGESRKVNGGGLFGCDPNKGGDGVKSGRRSGGEGGLADLPLVPVSDCITPFSFIFSTGFKRARS